MNCPTGPRGMMTFLSLEAMPVSSSAAPAPPWKRRARCNARPIDGERAAVNENRVAALRSSRPEKTGLRHREAERMAAKPVERDLRGEQLDPVAGAPELVAPGDGARV